MNSHAHCTGVCRLIAQAISMPHAPRHAIHTHRKGGLVSHRPHVASQIYGRRDCSHSGKGPERDEPPYQAIRRQGPVRRARGVQAEAYATRRRHGRDSRLERCTSAHRVVDLKRLPRKRFHLKSPR